MIFTEEQKEDIYRSYYKKVFGYIHSKITNVQTAEDMASDVFMKVYEKLDSYDETKASLSTWIYNITRNTVTDHFRTRRVFEEIPETMPDEDSSVEEEVCGAETLQDLASALKKLDERERDIIILRYYSGKTLKEIADSMGISYAYVKILQNKALVSLKNMIGE